MPSAHRDVADAVVSRVAWTRAYRLVKGCDLVNKVLTYPKESGASFRLVKKLMERRHMTLGLSMYIRTSLVLLLNCGKIYM